MVRSPDPIRLHRARSPPVAALLARRRAAALSMQSGRRGMLARTERRWLALEKLQRVSITRLQRNWRLWLLYRYIRQHRSKEARRVTRAPFAQPRPRQAQRRDRAAPAWCKRRRS